MKWRGRQKKAKDRGDIRDKKWYSCEKDKLSALVCSVSAHQKAECMKNHKKSSAVTAGAADTANNHSSFNNQLKQRNMQNPSQFPEARSDVIRLLVLSNSLKPRHIKLTIT